MKISESFICILLQIKILNMKSSFAALLLFVSVCGFSQSSEEEQVKATINNFFDGMRNSDSTTLRNNLTANAVFQTISANNEVKSQNPSGFVTSVGKAVKGSLDERITFGNINIDGNLAAVWTPYEFYLNGKFSHCGVNSFQLHKENGQWKIQYVIDTRRKEGCVK
jgi:hypothetical protein